MYASEPVVRKTLTGFGDWQYSHPRKYEMKNGAPLAISAAGT
jgi:hypothetical protein